MADVHPRIQDLNDIRSEEYDSELGIMLETMNESHQHSDAISKGSNSSRRSKHSKSKSSSRRRKKSSSRSPKKERSSRRGLSSSHRSNASSKSRSRSKSLSISSRSHSADLELSLSENEEDEVVIITKPPRKAPKGSSREFRERAAKSSSRRVSSEDLSVKSKETTNTNTTSNVTVTSITNSETTADILYGGSDEFAKKSKSSPSSSSKSKAMSKRGESKRHIEDLSVKTKDSGAANSSRSTEVLYGNDDDAKAKAKASRRGSRGSSRPGTVESYSHHSGTTNSTGTSMDILYGEDAKAKEKASRRGLGDSSSHHSKSKRSKMDLLYGSPSENKKSKASSRRIVSTPGVEQVHDNDDDKGRDTRELLYGGKGNTKSSRVVSPNVASNDSVANSNGDEAPEAAVHGEVVQEKKGRRRSKLWIIVGVLAFLFVLIVGGVATFIVLRNNNKGADTGGQIQTDANATAAPSASKVQQPTMTNSSLPPAPTDAPTATQIYDPPSLEDCQAIANNQTLAGQGNATRSDFNIQLDVTLSVHGEVSDEMVEELMRALQQIFIPALAGCEDEAGEDRRLMRARKRQLSAAAQYIILNGFVRGIEKAETECLEGSEDPTRCFRLVVEVSVYLKGPARIWEIATLISQEGQGDEPNLVVPFDLPYPFSEVKIIGVNSLAPMEESPSAAPTDTPSESPSRAPSTPSPSSSPTSMPVVGPSPPPTASPTFAPTIAPSTTPSAEGSASPTVQTSGMPSTIPSISPTQAPVVGSSSPTISFSSAPSRVPSHMPSWSPSYYPSTAPSPAPSKSPTLYPTSGPTSMPSLAPSTMSPTTQCYCTTFGSCDATTNQISSIGCGSCGGVESCILMSAAHSAPSIVGSNSCQNLHACESTKVESIQDNACVGEHSCYNRIISVQNGSCHGYYSCAASYLNADGELRAGTNSCHGQLSCYSHVLRVRGDSCHGEYACAGRSNIFIAGNACKARNACSGAVFTNNNVYQAQTQPSYFGRNSCTCENCCVCMLRVVSGRCTSPGECCNVADPRWKVAGVQDNTEEEMRRDLGVTDLLSLFV